MSRTVKFLDEKEIQKRYPKERNSNATRTVWDYMDKGYGIARIYELGLSNQSTSGLIQTIRQALEENFPEGAKLDIASYMDITELVTDTVYVVFKHLNKK